MTYAIPLEPSDRHPPRLLDNFRAVAPVPRRVHWNIERTVAVLCERWVRPSAVPLD
jgi:hypothetical protein